ncbi:MAG: hypothetical protein JST64_01035, partial [Actinobacteria bacterium]|nr:hypothetical protein [Actinomycetota bacterium]
MGSMRERPKGSGRWELRVYSHRSEAGRDVYRSKVIHGTERAAKHALSA